MVLDLSGDVATLTAALVDIESVSHDEQRIADEVEARLRELGHLAVTRTGHTIVARTSFGRAERVVIAGHLDTVPIHGNLPARLDERGILHGLGACDMKGGVAVALKLAATLPEPARDVTYVFYEAEEVAARHNGLMRLARDEPEALAADFAILMEPSDAGVEAGCQGSLRVLVHARGVRAHSARAWTGKNAIHAAADILLTLRDYAPRIVEIDGLRYREGLNAVAVSGGVAGNVIPDSCAVTVNYRFAPDRDERAALAHVRELFGDFELTVDDSVPAARPGLAEPSVAAFVAAIGEVPRPKLGWTDVARFAQLGIPAVNYGPGDPSLAHTAHEQVPIEHLYRVESRLRAWLTG